MKKRRSTHRTQWAAQFAVASELSKRNYEVAVTLGNHPAIDLMVRSPRGKQFLIDVKGLYKPTFWGVSQKKPREKLYYVFALVPDKGSNRFYILPQKKVNDGIKAVRKQYTGTTKDMGTDRFPGVPWLFVQPHENKWDVLPK
jgi:hypothetical protein